MSSENQSSTQSRFIPKILILEEDPAIRSMVVSGLKSYKNARVYEANSLEGMKSRSRDFHFDMIVVGSLVLSGDVASSSQRYAQAKLYFQHCLTRCSLFVGLYETTGLMDDNTATVAQDKRDASRLLSGALQEGAWKSIIQDELNEREESREGGRPIAQIQLLPRPDRPELLPTLSRWAGQLKEQDRGEHGGASTSTTERASLVLWAGPKDHPFAKELEKACSHINRKVISVESAQHALRETRRIKVEVSFVHSDLSDMAGLSLVRSLRREVGDSLPVAYVNSSRQVSDRLEGVHAGVSLYLNEAAGMDAISQALRQLQTLGSHGTARLLLIDDDEANMADHLSETLERCHFSVTCLTSPLRALELLSELPTDLLMIHIEMQSLGGFELCRTIRAMPEWQALPIILVGDRDDNDLRMATYRSGADDYLVSTSSDEMMISIIEGRLERSRLVQERADRDGLTGLLIRRAFNDALLTQMASARRRGSSVAVCLIDLDHFKSINDTYGHVAGDRVLSSLGRLLSSSFRVEDLRGRWGGEEFVVAFSDEDGASAYAILERARREFIRFYFDGEYGERFQATFSAGIACYPQAGLTIEDVFKVADRRLYAVKEAGRNSIFYEDVSDAEPNEGSREGPVKEGEEVPSQAGSAVYEAKVPSASQNDHHPENTMSDFVQRGETEEITEHITAVVPFTPRKKNVLPAQISEAENERVQSPLPHVINSVLSERED